LALLYNKRLFSQTKPVLPHLSTPPCFQLPNPFLHCLLNSRDAFLAAVQPPTYVYVSATPEVLNPPSIFPLFTPDRDPALLIGGTDSPAPRFNPPLDTALPATLTFAPTFFTVYTVIARGTCPKISPTPICVSFRFRFPPPFVEGLCNSFRCRDVLSCVALFAMQGISSPVCHRHSPAPIFRFRQSG